MPFYFNLYFNFMHLDLYFYSLVHDPCLSNFYFVSSVIYLPKSSIFPKVLGS